jgi:hypothetical protein
VNLKDCEKHQFLHDLIIQKTTNFCNEEINTVARKIYKQNLKIIRLNILPERKFNFESILPFDSNRNRKQSNGTLNNLSLLFPSTQQVKMAQTGRAKKITMFKNKQGEGGGGGGGGSIG